MSKWNELATVIYGRETTVEETREVKQAVYLACFQAHGEMQLKLPEGVEVTPEYTERVATKVREVIEEIAREAGVEAPESSWPKVNFCDNAETKKTWDAFNQALVNDFLSLSNVIGDEEVLRAQQALANAMAFNDSMDDEPEPQPFDPYCNRKPNEIEECIAHAEAEGLTPDEYVRKEEGTYNRANGHFACDDCYIKLGMPTREHGWKAP